MQTRQAAVLRQRESTSGQRREAGFGFGNREVKARRGNCFGKESGGWPGVTRTERKRDWVLA